MKSNLARSAICAKRRKDSNSMWLPERGSLHTVVLLTPGKWAARWICLRGLLIFCVLGRCGSGGGVPVGRPGQAEKAAQGSRPVARVGGAEQAATLQLGDERLRDLGEVVGQ